MHGRCVHLCFEGWMPPPPPTFRLQPSKPNQIPLPHCPYSPAPLPPPLPNPPPDWVPVPRQVAETFTFNQDGSHPDNAAPGADLEAKTGGG